MEKRYVFDCYGNQLGSFSGTKVVLDLNTEDGLYTTLKPNTATDKWDKVREAWIPALTNEEINHA